ncbi:MAG TPA: ribosome biogenesis GTPase Der [Gammaproteobacteria bacterium]|nr:ribosome biogenesis GTPase Der [Gammaproteobacteria bacterium]
MLPVIAIVGRPNVGKSTLFNCFTRSRDALVSDFPGMTRDRQYGEANIADRRFIVIDTGGLTEEKNDLDLLMAEQSFQAIQEADKIIFLVDARAGLTASDLSIAEKLRPLQKNIVLVLNKAEGLDSDIAAADFFRLGLGQPYAISAAHISGIDDLVHILLPEEKPEISEEDEASGIKLAIIGRPNVGKSTLTNRMLGEERVIVFDQPGTTRDSIFIPLARFDKHYTLIDTAGVRQRGKIFETTEKFSVVKTLQAVEATNVVLFVMDAREGVTEQDLRLLGFVIDSGKALVVAINKWDGLSLEDKEKTRASIDRRLNFIPYVRIQFISALHGTGVGNLFDHVDEAYQSANKKLATPKLTKILQEAIVKHSPPMVQGRRIKLRYAHSGGNNPPRIIIHGNQVSSLPDAYRRYLANTFQTRLKLMGTPVRIEMKSSSNPFRHKKNILTPRQQQKKKRLMRHVKK